MGKGHIPIAKNGVNGNTSKDGLATDLHGYPQIRTQIQNQVSSIKHPGVLCVRQWF